LSRQDVVVDDVWLCVAVVQGMRLIFPRTTVRAGLTRASRTTPTLSTAFAIAQMVYASSLLLQTRLALCMMEPPPKSSAASTPPPLTLVSTRFVVASMDVFRFIDSTLHLMQARSLRALGVLTP